MDSTSMGNGPLRAAQPEEMPPWASPGKIRFARWDGGSLEIAKGVLSNWKYLYDPKAMEATARWYDDSRSLDLLLSANINMVWVTFSNGFSMSTERPFQEKLAVFVKRCHGFGIRVLARVVPCQL